MTSDTAQIIAGFTIALAYVPQILKMKKNLSSEDVSLSFLALIWFSLILMGWYSVDKYMFNVAAEGHFFNNQSFALVVTNISNFIMVTVTVWYALKLRR